jgi:hypothetical protein
VDEEVQIGEFSESGVPIYRLGQKGALESCGLTQHRADAVLAGKFQKRMPAQALIDQFSDGCTVRRGSQTVQKELEFPLAQRGNSQSTEGAGMPEFHRLLLPRKLGQRF